MLCIFSHKVRKGRKGLMNASFLLYLMSFLSLSSIAAPRLAFQVFAVRDLCERDFAGTLKAAKALGYEGVETGRFYGLDAKGLKSACDDAGLELVALQLYPHILVRWRTLRRASSI